MSLNFSDVKSSESMSEPTGFQSDVPAKEALHTIPEDAEKVLPSDVEPAHPMSLSKLKGESSHVEQVAHSGQSTVNPSTGFQSDSICSPRTDTLITSEERATVVPARCTEIDFDTLGTHLHPTKPTRGQCNPTASTSKEPEVTPRPIVFRRSSPRIPNQESLVASSVQPENGSDSGAIPRAITPPHQAHRTPHQYGPVQETRLTRPMAERYGPYLKPVEEQSEDGGGESRSDREDEDEDRTSLVHANRKKMRGFFETYLRLRTGKSIEDVGVSRTGMSPHACPIREPRPAFSPEELRELGVPTVKLVPKSAIPAEQEEPLPFWGADSAILRCTNPLGVDEDVPQLSSS